MTIAPEQSTTISALAKALCKAQGKLKNVHKDTSNPFYKAKYASLPDILNIVRPVLAEHGLCIVQQPLETDNGPAIRTVVMHESGEFMASTLMIRAVKQDPQGVGSAITYARRYGVQSFLNISGTDDDDDGNEGSGQQQQQQPTKQQQSNGVNLVEFKANINACKLTWPEVVEMFNKEGKHNYQHGVKLDDVDAAAVKAVAAKLAMKAAQLKG